jgi:hypothetical protein
MVLVSVMEKGKQCIVANWQKYVCAVAYDHCDIRIGVNEQTGTSQNTPYSTTTGLMYPHAGSRERDAPAKHVEAFEFNAKAVLSVPEVVPTKDQKDRWAPIRWVHFCEAWEEAFLAIIAEKSKRSPALA